MSWIFYAIASYAFVSVANITDKYILEKHIRDANIIVFFSGIIALLTGILIICFRGLSVFPLNQTLLILLAGILLVLYLLPYFKALDLDDASKIVPLFQAIPVFTLLLSAVFLGENLSLRQFAGFGIILACGWYLSKSDQGRALEVKPYFWLMMVSSFLCAASSVLFKSVVQLQDLWDSIAYESIGMGIGVVLVSFWPGYLRKFIRLAKTTSRTGYTALSISEIFYILFRITGNIAYSLGPVALVNVFGGFQPLFILLYGYLLTRFFPKIIKEDVSGGIIRAKALSLIGIFIGLFFIYT
jgi:uncharacterized membrane protein